ncbi:MAG: 16S rRNA (uracil(1498)-N(3))-methyltransferase, partial [Gammaproteobacteria bacterium]|nr:16S rRNA (uracil(1498)-N(3))-methyltransferase [Gammaproteobacteria bacterium]
MTLPRFFVEGSIKIGKIFPLPEVTGHHLARVLRKSTAESIIVFNGEGGEFICSIESIRKNHVEVRPLKYDENNRAPQLRTTLGLCILKKDSMNSVLTKVTELGITRITPIISDHCAVAHKVIHRRQTHWRQVMIAAWEQCGLNLLPALDPATNLSGWLANSDADIRLLAVPGSSTIPHTKSEVNSVSLLTGPEGGFSEAEEKEAINAG